MVTERKYRSLRTEETDIFTFGQPDPSIDISSDILLAELIQYHNEVQ